MFMPIYNVIAIPRWNWKYSSAMWITNDKKHFKIITQRCKPPTAKWLKILEYLKVDAQHSKQAKIYQPQVHKHQLVIWTKNDFSQDFLLAYMGISCSRICTTGRQKRGKIRRTLTRWGIFEDVQSRTQTKWLSSIESEKSLGESYHVIFWWARSK